MASFGSASTLKLLLVLESAVELWNVGMSKGLSRFKQTQYMNICIFKGGKSDYSFYKELNTKSALG